MKYSIKNSYILILSALLIVFLISANIAWLNPRPDFHVYKIIESIPLFWQYNVDSPMELLTAAYFPEYFAVNDIRISRPGYPVLVKCISLFLFVLINLFHPVSILVVSGMAYLILKFLIYFLSSILLYKLIKYFFDKKIAVLSVIVIYFHHHSIFYATTFHTSELAFIIPIIISYFFLKLFLNYSHFKNILFSFIIGFLMLCRPDYAIYLSILILCFLKGYFKETIISFTFHLLPIFIYLIYLQSINIEFNHHGIEKSGYFSWFFEETQKGSFGTYIYVIFLSIVKYFHNLFTYFTIFFIFFIFGLIKYHKKINTNFLFLIILFFFLVWLQTFITNRWGGYMVADLSVVIIPLSLVGIKYINNNYLDKLSLKKYINFFIFTYCILMILSFIHLPWIHPYDQKKQSYNVDEFIESKIR